MIHSITLQQAADLLECATIEQTTNLGHTIVHIGNLGTKGDPCRFVMINDAFGNTSLSY
ncbi:hypothetical protein [Cupriavidus basilensis]